VSTAGHATRAIVSLTKGPAAVRSMELSNVFPSRPMSVLIAINIGAEGEAVSGAIPQPTVTPNPRTAIAKAILILIVYPFMF
jgi:hypothetical protein